MSTRASIGARMGRDLAPGPRPTGHVEHHDGVDLLVFRRALDQSPERVWELVTEPTWTEQWLGTWTGDPLAGGVDFWADSEDSGEPVGVHYDVERLEAPRLIDVVMTSPGDGKRWRHVVTLEPNAGGGTDLTLRESVPDRTFAPLVGSGADFYLDRLVEFAAGRNPWVLSYDDYVASQAEYYRQILPVQRRRAREDSS